jgi:hypothetical protein
VKKGASILRASSDYLGKDPSFWAYVRLISERVGYSKNKQPIRYTFRTARNALRRLGLSLADFTTADKPSDMARGVLDYLNYRAEVLTSDAEPNLMNGEEAEAELERLMGSSAYHCPLPMNKQKGSMKHLNYFTCLVNVIAEQILGGYRFDGDPHNLTVVLQDNMPVMVSVRRLDGAYPSILDARAVWEIKEYYDNKSFGSRIADGVYETLLDGYELKEVREHCGVHVQHYLFLDSYSTWWEGGGIPYLCRLIDALHMGLVDEIIVGREVLTRWPEIVRSWLP